MATVVITGASRGIGLELVRQYAADGDYVFALCRNPKTSDKLKAVADRYSRHVTTLPLEVTDAAQVAEVARRIGDVPVDILINNAGINPPFEKQTFLDMDLDVWRETFEIMTIAPFRIGQTFLDKLLKAKQPKLVTISSELGSAIWQTPVLIAYGSAKAALNRTWRAVAMELKDKDVIVLPIHPGLVKTDMSGAYGLLEVEESVSGVRNVIARATMADSGKFYQWDGQIHPW